MTFEEWWETAVWGNEDYKDSVRRGFEEGFAAGRKAGLEEAADIALRGTSKTPEPAYPHSIRARIYRAIRAKAGEP